MECKNCGHSFEGSYCNHCGQKADVKKINFQNFLNETSSSVFQIDRGIIFTLKELFIRPGQSLNDFLNGKRKNHFKPIAYLIILTTVYALAARLTQQSTLMGDILDGWMMGVSGGESEKELPEIANWFLANYAYLILILVPVFSLASFVSFYPLGKTYLEHVVINSYITGQQAIIYLFFLSLSTIIKNELMEIIPLLLAVTYTVWVYWQLFSSGNRLGNLLRSLSTYLLYLVFCTALLGILMANADVK